MAPKRTLLALLALFFTSSLNSAAQETWCGKKYRDPNGNEPPPSSDPYRRTKPLQSRDIHGTLVFQSPFASSDLLQSSCNLSDNCPASSSSLDTGSRARQLRFNVQPRFLPYSFETKASLLVELLSKEEKDSLEKKKQLWFEARRERDGAMVVKRTAVSRDKVEELAFELDDLVERPTGDEDAKMDKLKCSIYEKEDSERPLATRTVFVLRVRERHPRGGSIVKIDALNRASFIDKQNTLEMEPFLGFGGMTSGEWVLTNASASLKSFRERGLNMVHIVPGGPLSDTEAWRALFDAAHANGLRIQYNMRHTYKNLTQVLIEVNTFKDHPALHSWYTADEPDGFDEDTKYTKESYELIKRLDPYHPVSLVLNCHEFRTDDFTPYTDILYSDPYPIGVDCRKCDATFGCCGCDMCDGFGGVKEVAKRTKQFLDKSRYKFQPVWIIVQAFGKEQWWNRVPEPAEVRAMIYLALTQGATGISWWISPSPLESSLSLTALEIKRFAGRRLLSIPADISSSDSAKVVASAWQHQKDKGILIFAVNTLDKAVTVTLTGEWTGKGGRWESIVGAVAHGADLSLEPFGVKVLVWYP